MNQEHTLVVRGKLLVLHDFALINQNISNNSKSIGSGLVTKVFDF